MNIPFVDYVARYSVEYDRMAHMLVECFGEDAEPVKLARELSERSTESFVESARYLLRHGLVVGRARLALLTS